MSKENIKVLMIGPGSTETISGGVVTVIESLIEKLNSGSPVLRIITMRPTGFFDRLLIYCKAIYYVVLYSLNKNNKIAHVHMASKTSFYRKSLIILILKIFKVPAIIHLHGAEFHIFYENSSKIIQRYIRWIFSLTERTVLLSNSWQKWYIGKINTNQSSVVYNGVRDYYDKTSLPVDKRKNSVLFLGRLGERKGIYDLLYAFKAVIKQVPDAILQVGGDGEIEKSKALARELQIEGNVEFLGWVNEEEKYVFLNQSKIYILPSYNEGLPMGLLEAMSTGLAVVSTDVGGIPEVVKDKENGLLVQAGNIKQISDALILLLNNPETSKKFGNKARESFLKEFNSVTMTKKFEEIYDDVLQ